MALVAIGVVVIGIAAVVGIAALATAGGDSTARRDAVPTTVAPRATTIGLPVVTAPPPPPGQAFTDPQGTYTLTIDERWSELSAGMAGGIEAWAVADPVGPAIPNVTVLTQVATGLDLATFLSTSTADVARSAAVVVDERLVDAGGDHRLGVLHYRTEAADGTAGLEFLAVVDVGGDTAVVATFTAPAGAYAALAGQVEPYLLTLRVAA